MGKRCRILLELIQSAAIRGKPENIGIGTIFDQPPDFREIDAVRVVRIRLVAGKFASAFIEGVQAVERSKPEDIPVVSIRHNVRHAIVSEAVRIRRIVAIHRNSFGRLVESVKSAVRANPENVGILAVNFKALNNAIGKKSRPHAVMFQFIAIVAKQPVAMPAEPHKPVVVLRDNRSGFHAEVQHMIKAQMLAVKIRRLRRVGAGERRPRAEQHENQPMREAFRCHRWPPVEMRLMMITCVSAKSNTVFSNDFAAMSRNKRKIFFADG